MNRKRMHSQRLSPVAVALFEVQTFRVLFHIKGEKFRSFALYMG